MQSHQPHVLGLVGQTPIMEVTRFDLGLCRLFVKLESRNPGGSIKDRIAKAMIDDAERRGLLIPSSTIIEATAGNTGIALALAAKARGYRVILVIPDKMSLEKRQHAEALGAEIVITRSDVTVDHPAYYTNMAKDLCRTIPHAYAPNQFSNPVNPSTHEQSTGPEIFHQMDGKVDAIVVGVGTGGTLTGLGRYFRKHLPDLKMILADPQGSILAPLVNTGERIKPGQWLVEGIGEDYVPDNCDLSLVHEAISIDDAQAFDTVRQLAAREGILAGTSSGVLFAAALLYCRRQTTAKNVLTFICDDGVKYLSKVYNNTWLAHNKMPFITERHLPHQPQGHS